jgi:triacylglycerol esterase/lipase EstA (alpha/beta hydrolase family)
MRIPSPVVVSCFLSLLAMITSCCSPARSEEISSQYIRRLGGGTVIVFVHGVLSDAKGAWTNSNGAYWPLLLTNDPTFNGADIFVLAYPTAAWATLSIDEIADSIRSDLRANEVTQYKKIVFLAHSMGGLIVRAYLLNNRNVAARTSFIYFFATPLQVPALRRFSSFSSKIRRLAKWDQ